MINRVSVTLVLCSIELSAILHEIVNVVYYPVRAPAYPCH